MDIDRFLICINGSAMDMNCWPTNIFRELEDMHHATIRACRAEICACCQAIRICCATIRVCRWTIHACRGAIGINGWMIRLDRWTIDAFRRAVYTIRDQERPRESAIHICRRTIGINRAAILAKM
jgi:hypothetical protein